MFRGGDSEVRSLGVINPWTVDIDIKDFYKIISVLTGGGIRYQVLDITLVGGSFFLPKTQLVHGTNWWVYCPFSRKTVSTWY